MNITVQTILENLQTLVRPGQVVELRVLGVRVQRRGYTVTASGYYDDMAKLATDAAKLDGRSKGIYFTLNIVNPALLSRANNRIRPIRNEDPTTADHDVVELAWFLCDLDPARPAGISSTDPEHQATHDLAYEVAYILENEGWPFPFIADSGNGYHLLYRISLPPSDSTLLQSCLAALDARFSTKIVKVDTRTFNPARIWKLYGTMAGKGDNTSERPHRRSELVCKNDDGPVAREQLEVLARTAPEPELPAYPQHGAFQGQGQPFDLDGFIDKYRLDLKPSKAYGSGRKWVFRTCPWNRDHRDNSAFLIQFGNGAISAGCHHDGCSSNNWRALRTMYEPEAYHRQYRPYQPRYGKSKTRTRHKDACTSWEVKG